MWTAQCSYIRQLISPNEYPTQMQAMFDETLNHSTLQYSSDYACLRPYHDAPNFWGLGRYALERWALSHPHVKPCDVLPIGEGQVSWDEFPQLWKPKLRRAPRDNAKALGIQTGPYKSTWARLNGRLFEWQWMYHATPPNTSWVWKWYKGFEDGASGFQNMCQSKIRQYNNSTQLTNAP